MAVRRGQKQEEPRPEKLPVQAGPPKAAAAPAAEQAAPAVPAQPKVENVQDQIRRLATLR